MRIATYCILLTALLIVPAWGGENWPDFRGPDCNGASDAKGLPIRWSQSKNVKWKTPIHDRGFSSPVVWGDRIWLTTAARRGSTMYAVCFSLESGKVIHDITVFEYDKPGRINSLNSYATPSPVIEAGRVYVHYGTFGTACIDTGTGKILWKRDDIHCDHLQGPVSSPVLLDDLLVLQLDGQDVQFVTALNTKTGKTAWRTDRPRKTYNAVKPLLRKGFSTPLIIETDAGPQLVAVGAQTTHGYDVRTGEDLWHVFYGNDSNISRPVSASGLVLINTGYDHLQLWAVRPTGRGDVTDTHVAWRFYDNIPLESSPLVVDDLVYITDDHGAVSCIEAKTGKTVWEHKLEGRHGASPVYAGGYVYFFNKKGKCTVMSHGREPVVEAENQLDEGFYASAAIVGSSFIFRTEKHLYRIAK